MQYFYNVITDYIAGLIFWLFQLFLLSTSIFLGAESLITELKQFSQTLM